MRTRTDSTSGEGDPGGAIARWREGGCARRDDPTGSHAVASLPPAHLVHPVRPVSSGPSARHILILRAGAIGDFVLTLPALAALRQAFPNARLTLVGNASAAPLALRCGYADAIHSIDETWVSDLFDASGRHSAELRRRLADVDLAVVWLRDPDGPVAANLRALGVETLAVPSFPPTGARRHVADHLLSTLLPLGIGDGDARPRLLLPEADRASADAFWTDNTLDRGTTVVALHPGSGGARKNWHSERFAAVADRLTERGARILLVGGPADERPVDEVRRSLQVARPVGVAVASLVELAAVLARCAAFLGNDSGVTHLSAAVGTPTVAVFGPTDPAVWAPRGERVTVLWKSLDCSPCSIRPDRRCPDRRCLELVSADEALRAVAAYCR